VARLHAFGDLVDLHIADICTGGKPPAPDIRVARRKAHAAPVFDDLEVRLNMQLTTISSKSPLAAAIRYALARMERLRPCLDNGILESDSNAARSLDIRPAGGR
jgi:hypothetical protein